MVLSPHQLSELLMYDRSTGELSWRTSGRKVGSKPGCGYVRVRVLGKNYYAHRIVWCLVTGGWPRHSIDHIDLNKSNNRFENLRDVPHGLNMRNRAVCAHSKTRLKGTSKRKNRYRAQISIDGRSKTIGSFETAEAAHEAYCRTAKEMFGEFARSA